MARLLERFVEELAVDGTEDGRPLAGRQGSKVSFNRLGKLDRVGHLPPSLASLAYYRPTTGWASVRRTLRSPAGASNASPGPVHCEVRRTDIAYRMRPRDSSPSTRHDQWRTTRRGLRDSFNNAFLRI